MTTVAIFYGWVNVASKRLYMVVSMLGRAACAHLRRVYPVLLGLGADLADMPVRALATSVLVTLSHSHIGCGGGLLGCCSLTGTMSVRKKCCRNRSAFVLGSSTSSPCVSLRDGNRFDHLPLQCPTSPRISSALVASLSHRWAHSLLASHITFLKFQVARRRALPEEATCDSV